MPGALPNSMSGLELLASVSVGPRRRGTAPTPWRPIYELGHRLDHCGVLKLIVSTRQFLNLEDCR
jgi:hypothetical protein